ncbi:hypothetical protein CL633_00490 [bacterium]|mgnify:CR=1 FL=1|nr:hypothetical protein [bacterium]|tara:strand:- start:11873 stop:12616 length:744 start_codon:yes stop_codon:yes gene_type:complete
MPQYKKNYLTKVIFRIDFHQIELGQLKTFAETLKKDFPILEEEKGEEGRIDFDFKTKKFKQSANFITQWIFYDKNRLKKIHIHPRFLYIEYYKYKNFDALIFDVQHIIEFIKHFKIKTINKAGLRHVNEIELPGTDFLQWDGYINTKLINSLKFTYKGNGKILRYMGQIIFQENFGPINFNYGLWNSSYPNEINEKKFVLDFDAQSKFPLDTEGINLEELVREYNEKIEKLFENAIGKKLKKIIYDK